MTKGTSVIGKVVPIPQGDWDINKRYSKLDIVYNNGKSYIARKEVPAAISLPEGNNTNNEYWQLLAVGTSGEQGIQGIQGEKGDKGDFYYPIFDIDFTTGELFVIYYDNTDSINHPTLDIDNNGDLNIEWG